MNKPFTLVNSMTAKKIDEILFSVGGLTIEIGMELAGQSVAHSLYDFSTKHLQQDLKSCLVLVGSGNNGGDALVAARHLHFMGVGKIDVILLKARPMTHYLMASLKGLDSVEVFDFRSRPEVLERLLAEGQYGAILDGVLGFGFSGDNIRAPYDSVIGWGSF